jgi:DNA mismatch repair protein MutL
MSSDGPARIQILPPALANQIAAGEVVERPASVLKELVENSLDAGAKHIEIEAAGAGIELIRVLDDGHGIHPLDLELALERHATSKLRHAADLEGIHSLGFRGEALPSIASVAAVRLVSRIAAEERGRSLEFDPLTGRRHATPAAHPVGTTVEVRGLFRGVPARRKFLRSARTEYLHLVDTARRLALSPLAGAIRFRHEGRAVFQADGLPEERAGEILGRRFVNATLPIDCTAGSLRMFGRIGHPDAHRNQPDQQFLYLNGRLIRDRQISHAIRHAYGELVPAGRFPLYLLHLQMDAGAADVNVHPTKHEVRFRQARDVHDFVQAAVRETLSMAASHPTARQPVPGMPRPAANHVHERPPAGSLGAAVTQIAGRYILTERAGEWILVDARALMQEQVRAGLRHAQQAGQPLRERPLLVPIHADVAPGLADAVERHAAALGWYGVELDCIASGRIRVRAIPLLLAAADAARLGSGLLELLEAASGAAAIADWLPGLVPERPCAGADAEQLESLLREFEQLDLDFEVCSRTGFWRTLGADDLARLVGKHDP